MANTEEPSTIRPEDIIRYFLENREEDTIAEWEEGHDLTVGTTSRWLREDRPRKIPLLTLARICIDEGLPLYWCGRKVV